MEFDCVFRIIPAHVFDSFLCLVVSARFPQYLVRWGAYLGSKVPATKKEPEEAVFVKATEIALPFLLIHVSLRLVMSPLPLSSQNTAAAYAMGIDPGYVTRDNRPAYVGATPWEEPQQQTAMQQQQASTEAPAQAATATA